MTLTVQSRFRGPTTSGNGGYVAGLLAATFPGGEGPVTVTLRTPPPLETPLSVAPSPEGEGVSLLHGPTLVAVAAGGAPEGDLVAVEPVAASEVAAISARYPGFSAHPFPECFVCGPDRSPGDGLRLFPGRVGDGRTACAWSVGADVAGAPEFVWAALDCPGGWAAPIEGRPMVLGRITALVSDVPLPGETCLVMGALVGTEGRKTWTDSTVYGSDGRVLGQARSTWIALP
ncbi:hypothetical protein E1212_11570 [Jiangella ureilytica]|uniref:Thioesterase family protein n=1 Tax=Jiangella ureilytica TaxID=2530374 RepID=A0A4R4RQZ8_9ACTN|nr:hypothetical protein [Jiangella ureilytica]TDC51629.1 hypothetical protein E1212_11570 [Jiangella ureilytica]